MFQNELRARVMNAHALDPILFQVRKTTSETSGALLSERLLNFEIPLPEAQHYFYSPDLFTWKIEENGIETSESNANLQNLSIEIDRNLCAHARNYVSLDLRTLNEIVMKILLPLIDEYKRKIKMKDDIIKIWENKYTQFNNVIEYLKFIKGHTVDNKKQGNIELAKIQYSNNVKIEEMRLELLKTQLNYVKEKRKIDAINSILTNILTALKPSIKELPLPPDTSVNEELNHSDEEKNELKYEALVIDEKHLQISESKLTVK